MRNFLFFLVALGIIKCLAGNQAPSTANQQEFNIVCPYNSNSDRIISEEIIVFHKKYIILHPIWSLEKA